MLCFKLLILGLIVKIFYKYAAKVLLFFHIGNYYLLKNVDFLTFCIFINIDVLRYHLDTPPN